LSTVDDFTVNWSIARTPAPWIAGGPGGREGEITFQVGLNDIGSFLTTLAGTTETVTLTGGGTMDRIVPLKHPDDPTMLAMSYRAEAYGTPNGTGASIHSTQFSHHRVRVQFATLPFGVGGDSPFYSLSTETAESFETIPNVTLHFSNGTAPTGEFGIPAPLSVLNLTTYLNPTPVDYALSALVGKINSVAFDDYPPFTLRFTRINSEAQQGMFSRSLVKSYGFQFRDPHWNKILRNDGVWDTATIGSTGVGRFLTADLNALKYM
jgi:hypothetical protein